MVHNPRKRLEYEKARLLRKKGWSYNEIKEELQLSKSTISIWCRDLRLTRKQRMRLFKKWLTAPRLGGLINKKKREHEIQFIKNNAFQEIKKLDPEAFIIGGSILYWAEGSKTKGTAISNSDPRIIEFMMKWFNKVLNISPDKFKAYLHIHYGNDELRIKKYWSRLTGIPLRNFGKCFIKPKGTGHRTNILPNGIIRIRVCGEGVEDLRHRILAWSEKIYELSTNITPHSLTGKATVS